MHAFYQVCSNRPSETEIGVGWNRFLPIPRGFLNPVPFRVNVGGYDCLPPILSNVVQNKLIVWLIINTLNTLPY